MDIERKVRELIEEPIKSIGFILDEVLYVKEDGNYYLRIVIDKNGTIDVEDCVEVTHLIDPLLDEVDYIKDSYILDKDKMKKGSKDLIVMHPLPRVNEISLEVDSDSRAVYFKQARYGMFVRMALMMTLLEVSLWDLQLTA